MLLAFSLLLDLCTLCFCFFPLAKGSKCLLGDLYLNAFDRSLLGFSCTFLAFRCRFSGNGTFQFTDAGLYRTRFKGSLTFPECWRDVALRADVFFLQMPRGVGKL